MVFSLINIQIREKISRESIDTFQDLLLKAREIELLNNENNPETFKKQHETKDKSQDNVLSGEKRTTQQMFAINV